jgi:UDP-N-acetylmuramate dehydrogenase
VSWREDLLGRFPGRCLLAEPLSAHTTFRIGGPAEALVFPESAAQIKDLMSLLRSRGVPMTVLGLGSNVLVSDRGVEGAVCSLRRMARVEVRGRLLLAQAGAPLDEAVRLGIAAGLGGMERLSGIPGSVGGGVWINAGAFGQEVFDRLLRVEALDSAGRPRSLGAGEISRGYRRVSGLEGLVVLSAEFDLDAFDRPALERTRRETLQARSEKQPLELPSAGSVFKRPPGDFASRLIDEAGLKGLAVGRARVSEKHAGFIVNLGGASAEDVRALIARVRQEVKKKSGVDLELEQVMLGFGEQAP